MSMFTPPKPNDAVLGSGGSYESQAAVLGGLEAVRHNPQSQHLETRLVALGKALSYGEAGIELVLPFLHSSVEELQQAAFELLKNRREPQVRSTLPWFSIQGIDDILFRKQLKAGKWAEADQLTRRLMARASRTPVEQMRGNHLKYLPQDDHQLIDRIWCQESQQRFGFSVQRQIWQQACAWRWHRGEAWCVFGERVGWRTHPLLTDGSWKSYEEVLD